MKKQKLKPKNLLQSLKLRFLRRKLQLQNRKLRILRRKLQLQIPQTLLPIPLLIKMPIRSRLPQSYHLHLPPALYQTSPPVPLLNQTSCINQTMNPVAPLHTVQPLHPFHVYPVLPLKQYLPLYPDLPHQGLLL